jgi:glycosyltransferase involved in cell wall biosynthesis
MKQEKLIYLVSLNPLGLLPLMRYIVPAFGQQMAEIISPNVNGVYHFNTNLPHNNIYLFKDIHEFYNHSLRIKGRKYLIIIKKLMQLIIIKQNITLYILDYQVLGIAILIKKTFRSRVKIVYHQFELFDLKKSVGWIKKIQNYILRNSDAIELFIFPEVNRAEFYKNQTNNQQIQTIIIPNTNDIISSSLSLEEQSAKFGKNELVIGHIGQLGSSHYAANYLKFIEKNKNPNYRFLFIGKAEEQVSSLLANLARSDSRVMIVNEIPHSELFKYYSSIDIGVILYRAVDQNVEFCAPNKLYEFWAHGIPVIAHRLKGLLDIWKIEEMGELIDFNDSDQINMAIIKLTSYAPHHRENLKRFFNSDLNVNKYLKELKETIAVL